MKYKLETIPVWDAFREDSECPFCLLQEKAEKRYLKYYLGNSAMNPETRVELNRRGFCPEHFSLLLRERSPQHLGLIAHTHLQDWMKDRDKRFPSAGGGKGLVFGKSRVSCAAVYTEENACRVQDCPICERMVNTVKRYLFTACYLWKRDEEGFQGVLRESKGFCLPHEGALLLMGQEVLSAGEKSLFFEELRGLQDRNFRRLEEELLWFTQKFKAENSGKPWGNSEDAHYRVIHKLSGRRTEH